MSLNDVAENITSHFNELSDVSLDDLVSFLSVTRELQPYIAWLRHKAARDPSAARRLPDNVVAFLSRSLNMAPQAIDALWPAVSTAAEEPAGPSAVELLLQGGAEHHLACHEFFPPTRHCTNDACQGFLRTGVRPILGEARRHEATLFSHSGSLPAFTTSLYCRGCHTRYHANFSIRNEEQATYDSMDVDFGNRELLDEEHEMDLDDTISGLPANQNRYMRTYYSGEVPQYLQVEKHVFVERELCQLFRQQTVFAHVAASSAARIYNRSMSHAERMPPTWPTAKVLRSDVVSDTFDLYSLLLHHSEQGTTLKLPHDAPDQFRRLRHAMEERNRLMRGTGQEYWAHACNLCMHVEEIDGILHSTHVAVMDGVCIGHPCCGVHNCQDNLVTNRTLFCDGHAERTVICRVVGCEATCESGHRTCSLPEHRATEAAYTERGRAMFQLKSRLRRAGIVVPGEEESENVGDAAEQMEELAEGEETEEGAAQEAGCAEKPETGNRKLRTKFGRNRTHNEQTMVRPCGVIIARATFYGAEGVADVVNFGKAVFPSRRSIPSFLFYDSNCNLWKFLLANDDHYFDECGLPVDVFHFKCKHKETDTFCALCCNPASFPELYDEDGNWRFNSSAAEQGNVWFQGFAPIVREMLRVRYDFFLDECIKERNRFTVEQLEKAGHVPFIIPTECLFP